MAKLKAVLDSLDGVADALKEFYVEKEGAFHLDLENLNAHPAVKGLSSALARQKDEAKGLKDDAGHWRSLKELRGEQGEDLTADAVHAALEAKSGDGDVETKIAEGVKQGVAAAQAKFDRELGKATARGETFERALRGKTVDADLDAALAKVGVIEKHRPVVRAFLKSRNPEMVQDGEKFVGMFKEDPDGIPRDIPIAEYVEAWSKGEQAAPYMPSDGGGSGAGGSGGGGGGGGGSSFDGNDPLAWGRNAEKVAKGEMVAR